MRRRRWGVGRIGVVLAVVAALTGTLAGCGDSGTGPETPPSVSGSWSGTSQGITLNLTLLEGIGGSVSGSGNMAGGEENLALTVRQGSHAHPDLTLVLGAFGYQDMNFRGRMSGEAQITGTLNGSGFDDFNFNLGRR